MGVQFRLRRFEDARPVLDALRGEHAAGDRARRGGGPQRGGDALCADAVARPLWPRAFLFHLVRRHIVALCRLRPAALPVPRSVGARAALVGGGLPAGRDGADGIDVAVDDAARSGAPARHRRRRGAGTDGAIQRDDGPGLARLCQGCRPLSGKLRRDRGDAVRRGCARTADAGDAVPLGKHGADADRHGAVQGADADGRMGRRALSQMGDRGLPVIRAAARAAGLA